MTRLHLFTVVLLLAVPGLSCIPDQTDQDTTAFEAVIAAHTAGVISRESPIRVQFAENVVPDDMLHALLDVSPLSFKPAIDGVAICTDHRTLEFRPSERLPAGQEYTASVALTGLVEVPRDRSRFAFRFTTMQPSFEVSIEGLHTPDTQNPALQTLQGTLITADAENGMDIEAVLSATQEGTPLSIRWMHAANRRYHAFTVEGITRREAESLVRIAWNGRPVGAETAGAQDIAVSAVHAFVVLNARVVQEQTEYVEVRFSDPLDPDQNLDGLIRVAYDSKRGRGEPPQFSIEENIVRVYAARRWIGPITLLVSPAVRNARGERLQEEGRFTLTPSEMKPQVRFAGRGVVLPATQGMTIPFEAVNLRAVTVQAIRIYENNLPQFLQVNTLEGDTELRRVGRIVWKKTIPLNFTLDKRNTWVRYGLDVAPLIKDHPGGLYRLTLSFKRQHVDYQCPEDGPGSPALREEEDEEVDVWEEGREEHYWDDYGDFDWSEYYSHREDPCHPAYYMPFYDHNIAVSRNVLVSDIGLLAKRGSNDEVFIAATSLKTARPLASVDITLLDYQQQQLAAGRTNGEGIVRLRSKRAPFLVVAKHGTQAGYLKIDGGSSLSVSHFDVAGETVDKGIKGFIYGERDVWRPGDPIHLTFILHDVEDNLPATHPVLFELHNTRGQVVQTVRRTTGLNGFYHVAFQTDPDAPTGNWTCKVKVGGVTFEKGLKVATVMPNRLKITLDFGRNIESLSRAPLRGALFAQWLHGVAARRLKADIKADFLSTETKFRGYEGYVFDDPARVYKPESQAVFEGRLSDSGEAAFTASLQTASQSPGMLTALFQTRVFEESGAFSTDQVAMPYHPYERYIGLRTPAGDRARGVLLTDAPHQVDLAALDTKGDPVRRPTRVEVRLYKIEWRWWWEKGGESLADYIGTSSYQPVQADTVTLTSGRGAWPLRVPYPEWGRYLIHARDLDGAHATGKIVYVDWPGWAGRGQRENPGGASVLAFAADKEAYAVGEKAVLTIPTSKEGRGLISIETGTRILRTEWIEADGEATQYTFEVTPDMAPNVYVHATFLQPHLQAGNDLPIRMYGVIPVKVEDPDTKLAPAVVAPAVFAPETKANIRVSEAKGRPMTYTVAVVDEGLLALTRFTTPDPWAHFYRREALGVRTWDLFDEVAGAYGGAFERLLAVGGDRDLLGRGQNNQNRFPPMVRFAGPFELKRGATNTHEIDIPQYVGSVRIMVIAGQNGAFGSAEKTVAVRKPLMVLGTLPRVLGPEESVELPVAVFALEERIRQVTLSVNASAPLSIEEPATRTVSFTGTGDQIVAFRLKTAAQVGTATVLIEAASGQERARQTISIGVRLPSLKATEVADTLLAARGVWTQRITFPGLPGTNTATLELSRIPPLNLSRRLNYLIEYPHGCIEQITSGAFVQLYLDDLIDLPAERQDEIEKHVKAAIAQLRTFQTPQGGFTYWPGESEGHYWATNYVGHFLLEAQKKGYTLPPGLMSQWEKFQHHAAASWSPGAERTYLIQAYRLYTLALAGAADLGAMNRLREESRLSTVAQWRLAAAYHLAGQREAGRALAEGVFAFGGEREMADTFGSPLRDRAMVLETLCILGQLDRTPSLVREISEALASDQWCSTQETAYALIAMVQHASLTDPGTDISCRVSWGSEEFTVSTKEKVVQRRLPVDTVNGNTLTVRNTGQGTVYLHLIVEGIPAAGQERPSQNGLALQVSYLTLDGKPLDPSRLEQGMDLAAEVTVRHTGVPPAYEEVALMYLVPSGWEIRNDRLGAALPATGARFDFQDIRDDRVYTYFDLKRGESKTFRILLNASYLGHYYLPMIAAEAMYDATIHARIPGRWTDVIKPGVF
jgi:uncharacterized protein YfaS (alpha-2-macroglobulin family)